MTSDHTARLEQVRIGPSPALGLRDAAPAFRARQDWFGCRLGGETGAQQLLEIDAELGQQIGVLFGIDLVG
jgi:hypothetical protein